MTMQCQITKNVSIGGLTFSRQKTLTADGSVIKNPTVPAAKTGTLTARTDANTGTATLTSGHGITTGAVVDVFWDGGSRLGMTVGTVSGTSVPLDGGTGTDLPSTSTALFVTTRKEEPFVVTGDDVSALAYQSVQKSAIIFAESDDTPIHTLNLQAAEVSIWDSGDGVTNPLAGADIAKIFLSNGSSTASDVKVAALVD